MTVMMELVLQLVPYIGLLAIIVSVVTEGLKLFPKLDAMPTKLLVYLVALVLTPLAYIAMMDYYKRPIEWFIVFACFIAAFFIAKISMNGWEDLVEIVKRCMPKQHPEDDG